MKRFLVISISVLMAVFVLPKLAMAATEFTAIVDPGNMSGTDYTSLSAWEAGVQTDLTAATTQVFSGTRTSTIADNATVYLCRSGVYQTHTGTVVHSTSGQILVESITGSATEQANDVWYTNNTCNSANYFTLSGSQAGGDSAIAVAKCRTSTGAADTTAVNIDGWTTSATNYIKVWTDPTENYRHQGKWDVGKYRLEINGGSYTYPIRISEEYARIEGVQILLQGAVTYEGYAILVNNLSTNGDVRISNNIIRSILAAGGTQNGIDTQYSSRIWDNVIYGFEDNGINLTGSNSSTSYVYNNTVTNNGNRGLYRNPSGNQTVIAKNNLVYNNVDNYNGTFSALSTNNLSGPGSDAEIPSTNARNGYVVIFADEANDDFHLDSADTGARNQGTLLYDSGDDANLNFTTDVDGNARLDSAGTWDIGADESIAKIYRSVGPSASTALATGGASNYGNLEIKPTYLPGSTTNITDYVATFWRPLPDNVGVGDAIQYDDDGDEDIDANDSIVFITKRIDSSHYSVRTASGAAPVLTIEPDADWSIFRSYTSLNNAESASTNADENDSIDDDLENFDNWSSGRNLVTNQEQWNIAAYAGQGGLADTTAVTIDGWTTSIGSFIQIFSPSRSDEVGISQRHQGAWDTSKYRLSVDGYPLIIGMEYTRLVGVQIEEISAGSRNPVSLANIRIEINNNILRTNLIGTNSGISSPVTSSRNKIFNNIIICNNPGYSDSSSSSGSGDYVYNNTFISLGTSAAINSKTAQTYPVHFKNNIFQGFSSIGAFDVASDSDYNSTNLGTYNWTITGGGTGSNNRSSQTFSFVDSANGDYHLAPGDSGARNYGTDLSNDLNFPLNTDIDSYGSDSDNQITRPRGTSWDIGADELITKIYRSVAPESDGDLPALATGGSNAMTISGSTATFASALADNIGVGDAIQYDDDNDSDIDASDSIVFITGRTNSQTYTVKTASGGTPTAVAGDTDWSLFRAYTSLANAESGRENDAIDDDLENFDDWTAGGTKDSDDLGRDIAANSEQWHLACYANGTTADNSGYSVSSWTTAARNYFRIYTPTSLSEVGINQRHQGKWDANKFRLECTNPSTACIDNVGNSYFRLEGIQINIIMNNNSDYHGAVYLRGAPEAYFQNNIIRGTISGTTNSVRGIGTASAGKVFVSNNIFYDLVNGTNSMIAVETSGTYFYVNNNTIYNCRTGIGSNSGAYVKNNIYFSNGISGANGYDTANAESDYNISDIAADAPGVHSKNGVAVSFVDAANRDFHISPVDSQARGAGISMLLDQRSSISNDIDGHSRPDSKIGRLTDIGADQSATMIYRSLAPGMATYLDRGVDDSGTDLSISGTTMTLELGAPDNVGVGDAVQYDSDGNSTIDAIAFIAGRTSSTSFTVQSRDGTTPVAVTNDQDWQIFRAYTSLDNAEGGVENTGLDNNIEEFDREVGAGDGKDIYTANQQWNIAAYANSTIADTTAVVVDGWTTYPTNYLKIYAPMSTSEAGTIQRHTGKWDNLLFRMEKTATGNYQNAINIQSRFVRVEGLQVSFSNSSYAGGSAVYIGEDSSNSDIRLNQNLIKGNISGTATQTYGIGWSGKNSSVKIMNNVVWGFTGVTSSGIVINPGTAGKNTYVYNNTVYGNNYGVLYYLYSNNVLLKNNVAVSNTGGDYYNNAGPAMTGAVSNVSSDASSPNSGSTDCGGHSCRSQTVRFVSITSGSEDFHLAANDTSCKNSGTDLSTDIYFPLSSDYDNQARPGSDNSSWDIGADEVGTKNLRSVGTTATNLNTNNRTVTISGTTATFNDYLPDNVGVGDVLQYQITGTYYLAFITGRTSSMVYSVQSVTGGTPQAASAGQTVNIFRAYNSLAKFQSQDENDSFDDSVENFDSTKNIYGLNYQFDVACYKDGVDLSPADLSGWTVSSVNYLRIFTPYLSGQVGTSQRHNGSIYSSGYYMEDSVPGWHRMIDINVSYTRVEGIAFNLNMQGSTGVAIGATNTQTFYSTVDSCLFYDDDQGYASTGFSAPARSDWTVSNCVAIGLDRGYYTASYDSNTYIYNSVAANCDDGFWVGGDVGSEPALINNVAFNNNNDYATVGYWDAASRNNSSDSSSAGDIPGSNPVTGLTSADFVDTTNKNFHLSSNSRLINVGYSSGSSFPTDIDGNTRNVDQRGWDIGADEAATPVFFSVSGGADTSDKKTGTPTVDISNGTATFSVAQTGNIGVGDRMSYGAGPSYAYITGKINTSNWTVQTATGQSITGVDDATVNSITRTFTNLNNAEAGASGATFLNTSDLYTNNYQLNFPCYYDTGADTTAVTIDGYTTYPTNYVKVYTPNNITTEANNSQRHSGKWDDTKWRIETNGTGEVVRTSINNSIIEGIQTNSKGIGGYSNAGIRANSSAYDGITFIKSNIIRYSGPTSGSNAGNVSGITNYLFGKTYIYNNLVYDFNTSGLGAVQSYGISGRWNTTYAYNNTIYNCNIGFRTENTNFIAKNNIVQNTSDGYYNSFASGSDYNLSDIASDAPSPSYRNNLATEVSFIDEAKIDFHLSSDDLYARNAGQDIFADANLPVTTDIDGNSRPTLGAFDIGADEGSTAIYRSVAPEADGDLSALATGGSNAMTISGSTATFASALADNVGVGDAIQYDDDNDSDTYSQPLMVTLSSFS